MFSFSLDADTVFKQTMKKIGELKDQVKPLSDELNLNEECRKGNVRSCSLADQIRMKRAQDGVYTKITSDEIIDAGVSANDIGNINELLLTGSDIINRLIKGDKNKVAAESLTLLANFKSSHLCHTQQYSDHDSYSSYKLLTKMRQNLNVTQLKIIGDKYKTYYFILDKYEPPIVVKVKQQGKKLDISYYRRQLEPSTPSNYKSKESDSLLAKKIMLGEETFFSYDLADTTLGVTFVDDGNSFEIKSSINSFKIDGRLDVGGNLSLSSENEFNTNSPYQSHRLSLEVEDQKVLGLQYENYTDIEGDKQKRMGVTSELYKDSSDPHGAKVLVEFSCENSHTRKCGTWLNLSMDF